jgi:dATP pyrophosphohydrolase
MGPAGAVVMVYRRTEGGGFEYLLLHRADSGAEYEGDWAWTTPSGGLEPGETIDECAARELLEETGLRLACSLDCADEAAWPVYVAEAPRDCAVCLSHEHDRFEWLTLDQALPRVLPEVVCAQLQRAGAKLERRS